MLRPFSLILKPCLHSLFNLNKASLYRELFVLDEALHTLVVFCQ